ncbi:MAG: serine/threonine protein phosphatase [Candidatus Tectimicrobiota bacterium]|nr:MAG: serine/threonine protein phosphatase [Candidatus Tectomicrobia bacterium]
MRLAFTSDLHTDHHPANRAAWQAMVARLTADPPDVFVCCGDVAADERCFGMTLLALRHLPCVKLFVPGNHDVWVRQRHWVERGVTSERKYYELLPALCREAGFHPLWLEPYVHGEVAFCGTMGWYDYSLRNRAFDAQLSLNDYRRKRYRELVWSDRRYVVWPAAGRPLSDEQLAGRLVQALGQQLLWARRRARRLVVVTHMLPFQAMVTHRQALPADYFSAFMGCSALGEAIQQVPEVALALAGHTHRPCTVTLGQLTACTSPLGYAWQWQGRTPQEMACDRLRLVHLD